MEVGALLVIPKYSSTWTGLRYAGALTAGYLLYAFSVQAYLERADPCLQAHEQHRKFLQNQPSTTYPLEPVSAPAEVPESQRISDEPFGQR